MRLFAYYALHTFKNQIKKLFKSWVLIFLLCCLLFGFLIGGVFVTIDSVLGDETADDVEVSEEIDASQDDIEDELEISDEEIIEIGELVVGGFILLILVLEIFSADKNGSKIFLPADVNLLFASPMSPQSVLLFRLVTQMGVALLSSIYFIFQIPNLAINLNLGFLVATVLILTWVLVLIIGKLLQMFFYILASTCQNLKKYIRIGVYSVLVAVILLFVLYIRLSGLDYYSATKGFFNHKISRAIPIWGWLKGFCMFAWEGNVALSLLCMAAIVASAVLLAFVVWKLKANFYEDAMAKSEETAQLLEMAQAEKSTGFVKRKKDRSEKLRRDGMKCGRGANVFFFRSLYNRFRFAHFGFLTKTTEVYLLLSVAITLFCKLVIGVSSLTVVAILLAVMAFFRTLGNPLMEDTSKDFFRLIPESSFKKLLWSVLGGSANCLMDILPALLAAFIVFPTNPLLLISWSVFILSIDFYGTNVGAFIDFSTPSSAGKMIKQIVQIMFIYFGLLPDIIIMLIGLFTSHVTIAVLVASFINIVIGSVFLLISPNFLEPDEMPAKVNNI